MEDSRESNIMTAAGSVTATLTSHKHNTIPGDDTALHRPTKSPFNTDTLLPAKPS